MVPPLIAVEPSRLVDEDAEAVKAKAQEELREEGELERMSAFDRPQETQREVEFGDGRIFEEEAEGPLPVAYAAQPSLSSPSGAMSSNELRLMLTMQLVKVKQSVQRLKIPRRVNRLAAEQERFIRIVKFGGEEYHTLDSYNVELQMEDGDGVDDPWLGEEELHFRC
eukprot:s2110_g15.t1